MLFLTAQYLNGTCTKGYIQAIFYNWQNLLRVVSVCSSRTYNTWQQRLRFMFYMSFI